MRGVMRVVRYNHNTCEDIASVVCNRSKSVDTFQPRAISVSPEPDISKHRNIFLFRGRTQNDNNVLANNAMPW